MKLIKQAILSFRQGKSDKVYEVVLCQVGEGQYVVNFRYGRRGSALREGTRTVAPVPLARAERVFAQLVASKTQKGYVDQAYGSPPAGAIATGRPGRAGAAGLAVQDRREQALIERLREGERPARGRMALDRAIWRAGELGIAGAVPLLIALWQGARPDQRIRRYSIAWALGRCGADPVVAGQAILLLEQICDSGGEAEHIRRIAIEGLRRLYGDEQRAALVQGYIDCMPGGLRELCRTGPAEDLARELQALLDSDHEAAFLALWRAYLIDNEHARAALLELLGRMPLTRGYFACLRQIFKAAEFRRDGEVFGLLAHRFEKTRGKSLPAYSRPEPGEPYHEPTRQYMRRRVWRTLRRLGQDRSPDFIKMAVGVLLPFTDADATPVMTRRYYRWRAPDAIHTWDTFAGYWAFNHLLYGNSPRYYPDANARAWRCRSTPAPGDTAPVPPAPDAREESFPELWEKTPQGLLHLCDESRCERVHEFAVKALRACPDFLARLDTGVAAMLLSRPYDVTAALGLDLAKQLYRGTLDRDQRRELVIALLECRLTVARAQARAWIDARRAELVVDTQLMATAAASAYADNREYARMVLRTAALGDDATRVLIGRLVAAIKALDADHEQRIADIGTTLIECYHRQMADLGIAVIRDLLDHPAAAAQELAGRLLLGHADLARAVPDSMLYALLDSPHESVRGMGAELLGRLSDADLAGHKDLLILLSVHEHADLREGVRPVIRRLAAARADFAAAMTLAFTTELMRKHPRGVHSHLLQVLEDDLRLYLDRVSRQRVWQLLHHKHPHAQELGGLLLGNLDAGELSVAELVKLSSHEILAVRRGAWAMCEKAVDRLERAMPAAVRLLDARWEDSRQFAFALFRARISRDALTPDILVAICDSVRPDVQQFGRELITRYFRAEDGETYLLRLGEHPSEALQLFASSYLETYAAGHPDRIRALEPYFMTVLSRINKGRVTRQRCIAFLHAQALCSRDIAEVAARVFSRQSATMATGDREAMIKAMVDIERAHPDLSTALVLHDVPLRRAAGEAGHGV
jgi:predicted DNA-binding WGR domain protein